MTGTQRMRGQRVDGGSIGLASVLLVGIVVLAWGYALNSRLPFYAGLFTVLVGVFTGIRRLLAGGHDHRHPRGD
jgi:hypothetical protein